MTIIHGEDTVASRNYLGRIIADAKTHNLDIVRLDGVKIPIELLIQNAESGSFFGPDKCVIIENFFRRPVSLEKNKIISYLNKNASGLSFVYFWESKEITASVIKKTGIGTGKLFPVPHTLFIFLDNFRPNNNSKLLSLLHDGNNPPELLFFMLVKRISQLIIISDENAEVPGLAPWQAAKLKSQAKSFSQTKLTELYKNLLDIEAGVKTGKSLMPLSWHLDLLVSRL